MENPNAYFTYTRKKHERKKINKESTPILHLQEKEWKKNQVKILLFYM